MYTVVNSWVYEEEGVDTGMPVWEKAVIGADAAVGVIVLGLCALIYRKYKKTAHPADNRNKNMNNRKTGFQK